MNTGKPNKFIFFSRRLMFDEFRKTGKLGNNVDGNWITEYQHLRSAEHSYTNISNCTLVCENGYGYPHPVCQCIGSNIEIERSFAFGFEI